MYKRIHHLVGLCFAACLILAFPARMSGQEPARASILLRQIRVHPSLFGAGIDTARLRIDILDVLRTAGRLAQAGNTDALSLDVLLTGPQPGEDGTLHVRGYVRIEVGANQAARGAATQLAWEINSTLPGTGSLRAIGESAAPEVIWAVKQYLASGSGGA